MLNFGIIFLVLLSKLLYSDYFLSFSLISYNNYLIKYKVNCVKALTNKNVNHKLLFKFITSFRDVSSICKFEKEKIFNYLIKDRVFVFGFDRLNKNHLKSYVKLSYPPQRFDIIIKHGYAYFYLKESN